MTELPGGTVTFLFTDIEGSTKLLQQLGADCYGQVLSAQRVILRAAFNQFGGTEIDTQGDSFFVSFPRATEAVAAVDQIQRALIDHDWPDGVEVRVRMALHTGEPWLIEEGYVGMDVHRAARIAHVGHGGQVLLSETTTPLVQDDLPEGVELADLGRHRLKDMRRPEHIHQLVIQGLPDKFPALNSIERVSSLGVLEMDGEVRSPRKVGACPYRGLAAFQEEDAEFFFGREGFTRTLVESLKGGHLLAVIVGSSGSGKSSAVFAGLLPNLRETGDWLILLIRPGRDPFHSLASVLVPHLEEDQSQTDRLVETQKLTRAMQLGDLSLIHVVERIVEEWKQFNRVLLVIDQFEELYTLCPDAEVREAFHDELLGAINAGFRGRRNQFSVLLTLRADFMGQALAHRPFADALQEGSIMLGPMNRDELREAIQKPAELQGAAFETGLVDRLLDDVGQEPGNLPLLEFALTLLWDQMDQGWMTHDAYEGIGRVEGALAGYADEVYGALSKEEQEEARRAFVQLVQPGEGTEDTRRTARKEELVGVDWELIQHLANERLVVTGLDESGSETVEVVHEALLRGWDQLRKWMDADRDFRRWQEGLRSGLRTWEASGRDDGALLRGAPLIQAEVWLETRGDETGKAEQEYIKASQSYRQIRQRERERRRRLIVGGLAFGLVVTLVLSVIAFQQRQNSLRQTAILLAGQAETELADGYYDRAVLLALTALEDYPYTSQAEHALGQAVSYNRALQRYTGHKSAVTSVAWSPDGKRIATSSTDNSVHVWDAASGDELVVISLPEGITGNIYDYGLAVKWSPDGKQLLTVTGDRFLLGSQDYDLMLWDATSLEGRGAINEPQLAIEIPNQAEPEQGEDSTTTLGVHYATGAAADFGPQSGRLATLGGDNTAIVWDASLQEQELVLRGHENDVNGVAWSPDETRLATASEDGTVRTWDAQSGELLMVLEGHESAVNSVAWSPDGSQLATAGDDGIVRLWNAGVNHETGTLGELLGIIEPQAGIVWSVAWSPDGSTLAIGTADGYIHLWRTTEGDVTSGEIIAKLGGHRDFVTQLAWSPVDNRLVSAGADGVARVWNAAPSTAAQTLPYLTVSDLTWSSDGRYLALPAGDTGYGTGEPGRLAIWDVAEGQAVTHKLDTDFDLMWFEADYSPDDHLILVKGLSSWPEGLSDLETIHVLDAQTGKAVKSFTITDGSWIRSCGWSPDGTQVAGGTAAGVLYLWDFATEELLNKLVGHEEGKMINALEWSPNGSKIATADDDGTARIWDAVTGETLFTVAHEAPVWAAAWSPDGTKLLTTSGGDDIGAEDNTIRIWDASSGKELLVLRGHNSQVVLGDWSPDGRRIVSSSSDGTTRLWDAETGDELLTLSTPAFYVPFARWSPDGRYVAVGMEATPAEIWRVWQSVDELVDYAKECCAIRDLTMEERQQFGLPALDGLE